MSVLESARFFNSRKNMAAFDDPAFDDHERVVFCRDVDTGLKAIIFFL